MALVASNVTSGTALLLSSVSRSDMRIFFRWLDRRHENVDGVLMYKSCELALIIPQSASVWWEGSHLNLVLQLFSANDQPAVVLTKNFWLSTFN